MGFNYCLLHLVGASSPVCDGLYGRKDSDILNVLFIPLP